MDKILLAICNGLSCFIICTILFQFMNERYKKSYSNKTLYIAAEIAMGITAFGINHKVIFDYLFKSSYMLV